MIDEPEEEMHLLVREDKGPWTIQPNVELFQPKNKDIVTFDIKEPHDRYSIHIFLASFFELQTFTTFILVDFSYKNVHDLQSM